MSSSNHFRLAFFLFLSGLLLSSCKEDKASEEDFSSIKATADSVMANHVFAWDTMIAEDDMKIRYMTRLLKEIDYNLSYDQARMSSIQKSIDALPSKRFSLESLSSSNAIDAYDRATDSVINMLMLFVEETPQAHDLPLVAELILDIGQLDRWILQRRNDYDDATMDLNEFIKENESILKKIGPPYDSWKPYSLFVLEES